jgi:hypothetical protein
MHTISRRGGKPLFAAAILSAAISSLLLFPSLASAHAIAGDRVFPATMAVDDPGVGDEANLVYGHQRVPGDDGDQSINTFDFEYDKLITPRLALSVTGSYEMQNNPTARGFNNFGLGLKYLLYVNEAHEFMTSVGVNAEFGGTGSRAIADNFSTISPTVYVGKGMGDLPDSLAYLRPIALTAEAAPALTTGAGQPNAFNYGFTFQYSLPYLQQHVRDLFAATACEYHSDSRGSVVEKPGADNWHGQPWFHLGQPLRSIRRRSADPSEPRERLARGHSRTGPHLPR